MTPAGRYIKSVSKYCHTPYILNVNIISGTVPVNVPKPKPPYCSRATSSLADMGVISQGIKKLLFAVAVLSLAVKSTGVKGMTGRSRVGTHMFFCQ